MTGRKITDKDHLVCLGAFAGAHGVKGDALVKTFTDKAENIAAYGPLKTEDGQRIFTLRFVRETKPDLAQVRSPEINSREEALALKGECLYVERSALPAPDTDEFYIEDLVGLTAVDETSAPCGAVAAVHNFGAGDLIELKDIPGIKTVRLIPFTKEAVPEIDVPGGRITIARAAIEVLDAPTINDDTGEIVSTDINVDMAAMREEDA
ncbi:MAG: ribosome maturation factor RimM [Pseudomonadota bacterium]